MRLTNNIERSLITEKSMLNKEKGYFTFKVNMKATKHSIAEEVKKTFGVDPVSVTTMIMPGKRRRIAGTPRFMKSEKWKKAVVKIKEGQKIDLFPSEK